MTIESMSLIFLDRPLQSCHKYQSKFYHSRKLFILQQTEHMIFITLVIYLSHEINFHQHKNYYSTIKLLNMKKSSNKCFIFTDNLR